VLHALESQNYGTDTLLELPVGLPIL